MALVLLQFSPLFPAVSAREFSCRQLLHGRSILYFYSKVGRAGDNSEQRERGLSDPSVSGVCLCLMDLKGSRGSHKGS